MYCKDFTDVRVYMAAVSSVNKGTIVANCSNDPK